MKVEFSYRDVQDGSKSFSKTWSDQRKVVEMSKDVTQADVFLALRDLKKINLPKSINIDDYVKILNERKDLITAIKSLYLDENNLEKAVYKINMFIENEKIDLSKANHMLKHYYGIAKKQFNVTMGSDFKNFKTFEVDEFQS